MLYLFSDKRLLLSILFYLFASFFCRQHCTTGVAISYACDGVIPVVGQPKRSSNSGFNSCQGSISITPISSQIYLWHQKLQMTSLEFLICSSLTKKVQDQPPPFLLHHSAVMYCDYAHPARVLRACVRVRVRQLHCMLSSSLLQTLRSGG